MIDKAYCMSSYLALRYIEDPDKDFAEGLSHEYIPTRAVFTGVATADEIDAAIKDVFSGLAGRKLGLLLSGGMDSANLAAYMHGCDAYTFRFIGGSFQKDELARAESFAAYHDMNLHYVDIDWDTVEKHTLPVLRMKGAPVHSIEPQLYQAALQAKADGVDMLVVGESADLIFGGMDQLLSRDWTVEEFEARYTFLNPKLALKDPKDMSYLFERYRKSDGKIDFMAFMDDVFSVESSSSYFNAFKAAGIDYVDPYAGLRMSVPLDLDRVRSGDSKYLVRDLFRKNYGGKNPPNKTPMPRPVDAYFAEWTGPVRDEFRDDIDLAGLTGNQKWQLWCLEYFLDCLDRGLLV